MVRHHAPSLMIPRILECKFQYQEEVLDQAIWKPNVNGTFTDIIRQLNNKSEFNTYTWHKNIPFKSSFLVWRALKGKLPTNNKLTQFGVGPVNFSYCINRGLDNIKYIFVKGHFKNHIWKFFLDHLGNIHNHTPLRNMLMRWWIIEPKNEVHKLIFHSLPIFICWNLWNNRCSTKYGAKQSSIARVKYLIFKDTTHFLYTVFPYLCWPNNWRDLVIMIEGCRHEMKINTVIWSKPPINIHKLNIDRSVVKNPGKIGGGGILRNYQGDIIFAFTTPLGFGTNNQEEIQAATYGVHWCVQHGYNQIILEVDSELLTKCLNTSIKPHWQIHHYISELQEFIKQLEFFQCIHT